MADPIDIASLSRQVKATVEAKFPEARIDYCLTCGLCASGCPATGIEDLDPRKFLRLLALGQDEELQTTNWIYSCTNCMRCLHACPMGIDVGRLVMLVRSMRPKEERPKNLQKSCDLQKASNSTGIPNSDFVWVVGDVLEEVRENEPEWADLQAPIDKQGRNSISIRMPRSQQWSRRRWYPSGRSFIRWALTGLILQSGGMAPTTASFPEIPKIGNTLCVSRRRRWTPWVAQPI